MGPFGNMIHQEENEYMYMYIIHAQMILESKYSDWNKYYTITFTHHLQIWNISQRFIALMCFTKVTQSYFIVDNLQFKKILLQFSTQFRTGYTSESFVIYMNAPGCIS